MTNEQIILKERIRLMKAGEIKGTGTALEYTDDAGNTFQFEEPEQLHTFMVWKELGRSVKKGEKAKTSIVIWRHSAKTVQNAETGEDEEKSRMYMKRAAFFTFDQTEPLAERKKKQATA